MPTNIHRRGRSKNLPKSTLRTLKTIASQQPWLGYVPDLPDQFVGLNGWSDDTKGVHIRSVASGRGEVITTDIGFVETDPGVLDTATTPVVRLQYFLRTDELGRIAVAATFYDITLMAITTGASGAGNAKVHRLDPSSGNWTAVGYQPHNGYGSATEMSATIDGISTDPSMVHTAIFPAGSVSHNIENSVLDWTVAGRTGGTAEPGNPAGTAGETLGISCMIICNNVDPVYVFPASTYDGGVFEANRYTELHAGSLEPFYAKSCHSWEGRMFYINTKETGSGAQYRQRIRWSALYDASPDPANPGSGAFDIRELSGEGLRLENLDPYLIAYFSDGIVFIERTGLSIAPHRFRVISDHRGLLGPHCVAHISPREHFIICTDGMFIMNSSGEFREVGALQYEGARFRKWHHEFFNNVDLDNRHLIQVHYDQGSQLVRISWKSTSQSSTRRNLWAYDPNSDRMFVDNWHTGTGSYATCFEDFDSLVRGIIAWQDADAPPTWADPTAYGGTTWLDGAAQYSYRELVHGDIKGQVYTHSLDEAQFDGVDQDWSIQTKYFDAGDPRLHTLFKRIVIDFIGSSNSNQINMLLTTDPVTEGHSQFGSVFGAAVKASGLSNHLLRESNGQASGARARVSISGTGPFSINAIWVDYLESKSRLRLKSGI